LAVREFEADRAGADDERRRGDEVKGSRRDGSALERLLREALSSLALAGVFFLAHAALGGLPVYAADAFTIDVIVANLSQEQSGVDKGAKRLHKELKSQFRYEGIRVLEKQKVSLSSDRVFDMKLPTLRRLRIRPLVVEADGALVSVDVSGLVSTDLKISRGQLVIIGMERFRDGKLVIAFEGRD